MGWQFGLQILFLILYLNSSLAQSESDLANIDRQISKICDDNLRGTKEFIKERRALDFPSAMAKFTQSLYVSLLQNYGNTNFVFSPLSIHSALSMLFLGSSINSKTHKELQKALGNINSPCVLSLLYRDVLDSYKGQDSFLYGNRVWIKDDFDVNEVYKRNVENNFGASVGKANFSKTEAIAKVNNWVSKVTRGNIKQLVDEFSPETKLFLANALYFNEEWKFPFLDELAGEPIFKEFQVGKEKKSVRMMELTSEELVYGEIADKSAEVEVVSIPYKNEDFEMQIIVPKDRSRLERTEEGLKIQEEKDLYHFEEADYFNIFSEAKNSTNIEIEDVRITMPIFKVESKFDASEALQAMGATEIFSDTAEFGRLSSNAGKIGVSRILHRAAVEVTKNGTEGAAATGVELVLFSAGFGVNKDVLVDRSFIFVINDKRNNIPVLVGRVADPTIIPDP